MCNPTTRRELHLPSAQNVWNGLVDRTASIKSAGTPGDLTDAAALDAWLKASVTDYMHATGTCRMGAPDDPSAVVDPRCRFIGIDGLSVVDASIIPVIPRANTHLTAVMTAIS